MTKYLTCIRRTGARTGLALCCHSDSRKDDGKERIHPVVFGSKRSSRTEERYKPYLLEFAGLKFRLDKFGNTTYGSPVEVETRDTLLNAKRSSTHARWVDGVLSHHIIDVRHRPGAGNCAADGLSRQFTGMPKRKEDGHESEVNPDWEAKAGIVNDLFTVEEEDSCGGGWMTPCAGAERKTGDGHKWSILDGEPVIVSTEACERAGVFSVESMTEYTKLCMWFTDEPIFAEVIDAFLNLDTSKTVREKRKARHCAMGYFPDDGKLWRAGDGRFR